MALGWLTRIKDYHGQIQALLYLTSSVLGLIVAVTVGIVLRNFQGTCFLYAQVVWDNKWVWPWAETTCDFVIYLNVGMTLAYAFAMFCFTAFALNPSTRKHVRRVGRLQDLHIRYIFTGMNPVFIVINSVVTVLVLCMSATLTGGFMKTCQWLVKSMNEMDYLTRYDTESGAAILSDYSCIDAPSKVRWHEMKVVRGITRGVEGRHFFNCYIIATICSWVLVLVWSFQVFFSILVTCQVCSCETAEEKRKPDNSLLIAQRRSRMATPIGTPGGRHTPVPLGQPMNMPQIAPARGPPPQMGPPPSFKGMPPRNEKSEMAQRIQLQPLHPKGSVSSFA